MKVKCGKGPGFWVQEPYTPFEERMKAHYAAEGVRGALARGNITEATMSEYDRASLANAPVPPWTDKEQRRADRLYPDDWWLIKGETWPPDPAWVQSVYSALGNCTGIMMAGGAPHRPNSLDPAQPAAVRKPAAVSSPE
jgi:hypothetical protein